MLLYKLNHTKLGAGDIIIDLHKVVYLDIMEVEENGEKFYAIKMKIDKMTFPEQHITEIDAKASMFNILRLLNTPADVAEQWINNYEIVQGITEEQAIKDRLRSLINA